MKAKIKTGVTIFLLLFMKKQKLLATFIAIIIFASIIALTSIVAQATLSVVPPVGSTCEEDASGTEMHCTFPDGSKWICDLDLKKCVRTAVKPSTSFPTNRPLGMATEKPGNGQTPVGSSNLIEKSQPPKEPSTIIGPKETKKQGNMVRVPKLLGMSRGKAEKTLKKPGLRPEFTGRGTVVKDQRPKPGVLLRKGSKVKVSLWTPPPTRTGPATVGPKVVQPGSGAPGVMFSSITVSCAGGNSFEIKTGTESGACRTKKDADGNVIGGNCGDKSGNGATVDCAANQGAGACGRSQGSGGCKPVK